MFFYIRLFCKESFLNIQILIQHLKVCKYADIISS